MYLFQLLTTDESSLVSQVFQKMVSSPKRGDWVQTVMKDLKDLNIKLSFSQIAALKKSRFKKIVIDSIKMACFLSLVKEKESLKKGKELQYTGLETQAYLHPDSGLSIENMRKIYHIRCREPQLKCNYPSAYKDRNCPYEGCVSEDTQYHLFTSSCFSDENQIMNINMRYEDIFGCDVESQYNVMKIFFSKLENRRKLLILSNRGLPADLRGRS